MEKKIMFFLLITAFFMVYLAGCSENSNSNEEAKNSNTNINNAELLENDHVLNSEANDEIAEREMTPEEYPQLIEGVQEGEVEGMMTTNLGDIHFKLFPKYAPLAVENFISLSKKGYYKGVIFHRVIEDFMMQGGDPTGTGAGGESIFGAPFEDEFTTALAHFPGAMSMVNSGPNTNSSQFYIVHHNHENIGDDNVITAEYFQYMDVKERVRWPEETMKSYIDLGGTPHLDFGHTVFGQVIDGMDVINKIAQVEVDASDRPVEDVIIESITIMD